MRDAGREARTVLGRPPRRRGGLTVLRQLERLPPSVPLGDARVTAEPTPQGLPFPGTLTCPPGDGRLVTGGICRGWGERLIWHWDTGQCALQWSRRGHVAGTLSVRPRITCLTVTVFKRLVYTIGYTDVK